jgi:ATP-dependent HslUV protease subunit HslV
VSGTGEVLAPDDDVVAVGSGGSFALAAARALLTHTELDARAVVNDALEIAAGIDIYTNDHITVEELVCEA